MEKIKVLEEVSITKRLPTDKDLYSCKLIIRDVLQGSKTFITKELWFNGEAFEDNGIEGEAKFITHWYDEKEVYIFDDEEVNEYHDKIMHRLRGQLTPVSCIIGIFEQRDNELFEDDTYNLILKNEIKRVKRYLDRIKSRDFIFKEFFSL